jgi:hypothetical protein
MACPRVFLLGSAPGYSCSLLIEGAKAGAFKSSFVGLRNKGVMCLPRCMS